MKSFCLGFVLALTFSVSAKALDVQLAQITVRDYFAGCALAGLISKPAYYDSREDFCTSAWEYANIMMRHRK